MHYKHSEHFTNDAWLLTCGMTGSGCRILKKKIIKDFMVNTNLFSRLIIITNEMIDLLHAQVSHYMKYMFEIICTEILDALK